MLSGAVFESGRLRQGAGAHRGGNSSSIAAVASGTMSKIVRATHASTAAPRVTNEANHETHRLQGIDVRLLRYTDRLGNRHSRCIRATGRRSSSTSSAPWRNSSTTFRWPRPSTSLSGTGRSRTTVPTSATIGVAASWRPGWIAERASPVLLPCRRVLGSRRPAGQRTCSEA